MMAVWTRKQQFTDKLPKFRTKLIDVPEWDEDGEATQVWIKELSAFALCKWESESQKAPENSRALLVAMSICDEGGRRIYQDKEAKELSRFPSAGIDRLYWECHKLSYATKDAIKELEKNSEATTAPASVSSSASSSAN